MFPFEIDALLSDGCDVLDQRQAYQMINNKAAISKTKKNMSSRAGGL